MIPQAIINEWREKAPWVTDAQIEQDLILSRALVEIFSEEYLRSQLAFRGGTALNKLILKNPARYSEDIDLVQIEASAMGETIDRLRKKLDPWLGKPKRERNKGRVILKYRFTSEIPPVINLRLKIEINTREHFTVLGFKTYSYSVKSRWFSGKTEILTYHLEEMLGTKLRALYQRKKGRDIFDIYFCLKNFPKINRESVVRCFQKYMQHENHTVSRTEYEKNLRQKLNDSSFNNDLLPLLSQEAVNKFDFNQAVQYVQHKLINLLPE